MSATTVDMPSPLSNLCADCFFDLALYLHGYVVTAPPISFVEMIDSQNKNYYDFALVKNAGQHFPQLHRLVTRPEQIRRLPSPQFRFQKSIGSDRVLIPCHQLNACVNTAAASFPVRFEGSWRRAWVQGVGPFALAGNGRVNVDMYGSTIGLMLMTGRSPAHVRLLSPGSGSARAETLEPSRFVELALDPARYPSPFAVLEVDGEVNVIGVTADGAMASCYANAQPTFDHLPD
jgi:hypothetical protein